ncbi:energy transducer TonB [Paraburkholderia sp. BL18I3N2]|uniref:energy transducer TonB n=1 Tax=Paraburkholderia sp. BL18I3N2 TaxID=1938799 RepID=UPI002158F51D|nr:energy transducer TonB [Paraburkholderia sp. BL18I3N2]
MLQFIVSRLSRLRIEACDNRKVRLTMAAALGAFAWGIFLVVLGRSLDPGPARERVLQQPLEVSVVDVPEPAPTPPMVRTRSPQATTEPHTVAPPKQPSLKPAHTPTLPVRTPLPAVKSPPSAHAPEFAPVAKPETGSPAQTGTAALSAPVPAIGAPGTQEISAGSSTGNSPARAIAQPLPPVPDELREQAYQTVATARLVIHTDGSVAVELIKPTQYPRLNQIVLETLRSWRFFPAMQDGHPVETRQDIRVHFNVS